jgi:hypothetical protein
MKRRKTSKKQISRPMESLSSFCCKLPACFVKVDILDW